VVDLDDACRGEVFHQFPPRRAAVGRREDDFQLSRAGNVHFKIVVNVAVGVAADRDRFLPGRHAWFDVVHQNRFAENRAVKQGADRAVGAFPGFLQVVFLHPVFVGRNRGALDADAVFLHGAGCVNRDPVVRVVAVLDVEIVVVDVHVQIGKEQLVFHHPPHDAGHFVSVHFDESCLHFDFLCHCASLHGIGMRDYFGLRTLNAPPARIISFCRGDRLRRTAKDVPLVLLATVRDSPTATAVLRPAISSSSPSPRVS